MPAFRFLDLFRLIGAPRNPNPGFARLYVDADGAPRVLFAAEDSALGGGGGSISVTDGTTTVDPATSLRLPAGTLTDLGGGAGGVGLLTQLIGPFHLAYNDPDIQGAGELLVALDAGTWLLGVSVIATAAWDAFGTMSMQISLAGPGAADMNAGWVTNAWGVLGIISSTYVIAPSNGNTVHDPTSVLFTPVGLKVAGGLFAAFYPSDPVTAGEADVYAIIATPAA